MFGAKFEVECVYLFPEITSSFFPQRCVTLPPAVPWHWMSHYPSHAATFCCLHNTGHRTQQEASILLMFLVFLYHCRTHSGGVEPPIEDNRQRQSHCECFGCFKTFRSTKDSTVSSVAPAAHSTLYISFMPNVEYLMLSFHCFHVF